VGDDRKDIVQDEFLADRAGAAKVAIVGAGCRIRTRDLLITNQLLYQLS
jgi:hypothetical protein